MLSHLKPVELIEVPAAMSKKRKREVDVELVQVYEGLADDAESVRLQAAYNLVSKIFKPGVTSDEQIRTILTRLFRGICSGRKSARLGFSVALTEFLSQLPLAGESSPDTELSAAAVVDILEAQTVPEGGTSGQDERDHYFGRVFGIDALLKSGILVKTSDLNLWRRVLDLLIGVAKKKPWLRQECGWTLLNCIVSSDGKLPEAFAAEIIDKLAAHKLIRTPEGLAIWLTISRLYPHAKLPQVWKHDDPLAKKDINVLADLLKDARAQSDQADTDQGAQGSARWSANLHFAWDVVLGEMFRDGASAQNGKEPTRKGKRAPFDLFWKTVVDGKLSPISYVS
jgi:DNA polymerase phi